MEIRAVWSLSLLLLACNQTCGVDDLRYDDPGGAGGTTSATGGGEGGDPIGGMGGTPGTGGSGGAMAPARVFVTSALYQPSFGGLAGGDDICSSVAQAGGLGTGPWVAWLSDGTTNAIDRVAIDRSPWQLTDGTVAVASYVQLTMNQPLFHAIDMDQNMDQVPASFVWTGTQVTGVTSPEHCFAWSSVDAADAGQVGSSDAVDSAWTDFMDRACDTTARLYCFEQ
jgi:hypothetical protein